MLALKQNQLTAEQRIEKAVVAILNEPKYVALAGVLMIGGRAVRDDVPTAMTNGRDETYGRAFVDSLSDPELRFLILHENYHKLYKHLTTWKWMYDMNPQCANQACDHVINIKISDENRGDGFATMPVDATGKLIGIRDYKYRGWDSAKVFHDLLENQDQENPEGEQGQGQGMDSHDWEGAEALSDEEKQELEQEIESAIRQGAMLAGKTGSSDAVRTIEEFLKPKVNWREQLRQFVSSYCAGRDFSTWKRPSRKYISGGIYMPSTISETVDELVVAIDTSGSIGSRALSEFLSEVKGIVDNIKVNKVRLLYWGTKVVADELYTGNQVDNLVKSTKPAGGGGTDVNCVTQYMRDNKITPSCTVVLTDGYLGGSWSTWTKPVLWAIVDNPSAKPNCGTTIHIDRRGR